MEMWRKKPSNTNILALAVGITAYPNIKNQDDNFLLYDFLSLPSYHKKTAPKLGRFLSLTTQIMLKHHPKIILANLI